MKKEIKFIKPEIEVIVFDNSDIITKSGDMEGGTFDEDDIP